LYKGFEGKTFPSFVEFDEKKTKRRYPKGNKFFGYFSLLVLTKKNGYGIITRHSQKNSNFGAQQILEN